MKFTGIYSLKFEIQRKRWQLLIKEYTRDWTSVTLYKVASNSQQHRGRPHRLYLTDRTKSFSRSGSLSIATQLNLYQSRFTTIDTVNSPVPLKVMIVKVRTNCDNHRQPRDPQATLRPKRQLTTINTWLKSVNMQPSHAVRPSTILSPLITSKCRITLDIQLRQLQPVNLLSNSS